MGVAGILGTDQERTVYRLVEQAATLLGGPDSAVPRDFMAQFLGRAVAEDLVARAHQVCPYSNATRNNIEVTLTVV